MAVVSLQYGVGCESQVGDRERQIGPRRGRVLVIVRQGCEFKRAQQKRRQAAQPAAPGVGAYSIVITSKRFDRGVPKARRGQDADFAAVIQERFNVFC